jgi:hypothetical protein
MAAQLYLRGSDLEGWLIKGSALVGKWDGVVWVGSVTAHVTHNRQAPTVQCHERPATPRTSKRAAQQADSC